ncbi:tellurium resistance protein TerC [Chryseobacterium indologenes]|uniref:Tellurium resistance protein TerC n=3 Tax=Chryseobacterium TaxID=59732 RepID=A0A3G6RIX1_CHRLC|nr:MULTISPECIES: MauE/DoxX family redox-associated membrane protein [Bacteroidota]AZA84524.1 tellurium resistance protein TerC [Chryseobacterium lactis]AZB04912.1 tellurium resistance protein TerC [Chryseobacterium lactis]KMQ64393.1 TerC family integral membrane protein [Chryseobacterium angstadtii]MBF6643673.1 tellurium resistance protein TerC [Chryseobacterium indologenes]PNW14643.1 tellurium resistance protein TerC [Chryseobacterium lactis]
MKKYFAKDYASIVAYFIALLFVYAAMSKLLDFENFQVQLAQSPLLSAYAGFISYAVIIVEFALAVYVCVPDYQLFALYGSLGLMTAFTIYIYLIINYSDFVPCSCGGILEKLGWTEHLIFNIVVVILIFTAILYRERKQNPQNRLILPISKSIAISIVSCGIVVCLFLSSEHIIKQENNFTRRFVPHPLVKEQIYDLGVNSYYFAGLEDGNIYLGNTTAPLFITKIDTALRGMSDIKVKLDNKNHVFRNLKLTIRKPYYYMYDGSVPVIYQGKLEDSLAKTISFGDAYFNQLAILDSMRFAIRTQRRSDKRYILASLDLDKNKKLELQPDILEKQIDGIFDVDGILSSDSQSGKLVYTYVYRNQYIVMDNNFKILNRLNTIDTTSRAKISVVRLSNGNNKMSAPPFSVNKGSLVSGNLLFNQSNLKGKHEPSKSWKTSSIIDVYSTDQQQYIGSFYIRHKNNIPMSAMIVQDNNLFVLIGNELVRYKIRDGAFDVNSKRNRPLREQPVDKEPKKGIAENLEKIRHKPINT